MNIPIVRLQVDQMRHSMQVALSEYTVQMDEMLQQAIADFCTPENLKKIIEQETSRTLDGVIREQVRNWFIHGAGREVIKKAVEQKLEDGTTWTPLDMGTWDEKR